MSLLDESAIKIIIVSDEIELSEYHELQWNIISAEGDEIVVQINFDDPLYISYGEKADRLIVAINEGSDP